MTEEDRQRLARIEAKLDALLGALDEDELDEPLFSLDGDRLPGARDEGAPL